MKWRVRDFYQEINYSISTISVFQAIVGPTDQATKYVDYIKCFYKHGFDDIVEASFIKP